MGKNASCEGGGCGGEGCARRQEQEALDLAAEEDDPVDEEEDLDDENTPRLRKQIICTELSHWILDAIEAGALLSDHGRKLLQELRDIRQRVEVLS